MFTDIRYALRSLVRSPAFTATSVLMLGLAAGANAAILALVYAILLKPLPYGDADRLVAVWPQRFQSNIDLLYLREHATMFESVAAVAPGWSMSLTGSGEPAKLTVAKLSGNLFTTLRVQPEIGRTFDDSHTRPGADAAIVLSHDLWTRRFGGDRSIVGRSVIIDGAPFEVLGVMPRGFEIFGLRADAYTPFALDASAWHYRVATSFFVARLPRGRSIEQADRDYKALIPQIRMALGYPDEYGRTAHLEDLRKAVVGDVTNSLVALGAAVILVLLVAGVNVSILQLTRASARRHDLAVCSALGASSMRIARQLLAEGFLLTIAGSALGVALSRVTLPVLVALLPSDTPRVQEVALSGSVGAAVLVACVLVAFIVGIAPLMAARGLTVTALLRAATIAGGTRGRRTRAMLVTGEIAATVVLAVGAGLMLRSVWQLQRVDPGFHGGASVLTMHLQPSGRRLRNTSVAEYYERVLERVRGVSGVEAAGAIQHLPFSGYSWGANIDVEGYDTPPGGTLPLAGMRIVTPGYFAALGQPIVAGRPIERADLSRDVVVVNTALARRFFGSPAAAIGGTLRIRGATIQGPWLSIVGVAADVRHVSLTAETGPEIYTVVGKNTIPEMMLAVRAAGDPRGLIAPLRDAIWSVDRSVPISDVQTMAGRIGQSIGRPRLMMTLLAAFAVLGALIAALGVYGVVAYSIAQRRREIGIMIALGARRGTVVGWVLRDGLVYAAAGLALGLPGAFAASRLLATLVFGVRPTDPATYVVIAWTIAALVMAACALPAYRASRIDPIVVLKET